MTVSRFLALALLATGISGHDAFASRPVCAPACVDSLHYLTGTVAYRERMVLPDGATLSVRIEERGEKPGAPIVMAEQHTVLHGSAPFPYALTYPSLPPEGHYGLQADITLNGAVLFATPPEGVPLDRPSLLLQRVAAMAPSAQRGGPATP